MFEQYYLPVTEAALITGFPVKKWIQWILKGLIPSDPELSEDSIKGINRQILARQTLIPVTALPEYYREEYLKIHLIGDSLFRIDFIGFLEHYGEQKYFALLNEINVIKEFITIRQYADSASKSKAAEEFALQSGYSIATLYRKENLFMQSDLRKLISAPDNIYHPRDMCRLSEDFARFEWDKPNHLKKCEILDKLRNEAKVLGTAVCNKCPYNKHTRNNKVFSKK